MRISSKCNVNFLTISIWYQIFLFFFFTQDTYHELVKYLIESQTDPGNRQRLMEAFRKLTLELPMSAERIYRIRFRENFEKFVVEVRGFLLIK